MAQRAVFRTRGFLSRGALLSILLHVHLLAPIGVVAWIYGGRQQAEREAQRAQEVDVEFKDVTAEELPKDLPPVDALPDQLQPKPPKPKVEARRKLDKKVAVAKAQETPPEKALPKAEPEVVVPPLPPMPKPERKAHEKMVDLDNDKEVQPPPDAKYLAQNNNRADQETRATDTNLQKAQQGEGAASEKSERNEAEPGADKQKIAELKDQKSALGRKAPEVTPHDNPELASKDDQTRKSLLALRDPAKKTHELTPETADPSLPRAADGDVAQPRPPVRGATSDPSRQANADRVKLALSDKEFEYLFGADAEAERRLAQTQRSTRFGKFQRNAARVRASLENFIPEVKPGNQTALNTRAAPFAAYIAKMHRSIHKLWGFGALEDWDELPSGSPLNNTNLSTTLELVLNRDGTIDKVTVVRASGYLAFDAAAIDVAFNAGPYPDPPRAIRSANGKIYVHWQFHRDERQCATSGVDYFILDNPPAGADRPAVAESVPEAPRGVASAPSGTGAAAPAGNAAPAPNAAPGVTPPGGSTAGDGGLRHLRRFDDQRHSAKMQRPGEEVAMAEERDGTATSAAPAAPVPAHSAPAPIARGADPAARAIAEQWFKALAGGDTGALSAMASLPFKTSGKDVTKRAALTAMLTDLAGEEKSGRSPAVDVYTTAGLRAVIGKLPANVDDGTGNQLYALASSSPRDALILILSKRTGDWRPIGLVRR